MMTDYDLPIWFWDNDTTDQDRSDWMVQERARRQAMRQKTGYRRRIENRKDRLKRKMEADADTVDVKEVNEDTFEVSFEDE